jgi:hypothetical protein
VWWSRLNECSGMLKNSRGLVGMASKRGHKSLSSPAAKDTEPAWSLPAAAVLGFLKETRGMPSWNLKDLTKSLRISAAQAKRAAALLEVQGYIERTGDTEWLTTVSGNSVSGSKSPRFTSEAVAAGLSALAERINAVNHDPDAPFRVTKAVAFGDFLSDRARVQAPDVGIQLTPQESESDRPNFTTGQAARSRFLKQLRGRTSILSIWPYEEWMSSRSHRSLV